MAGVDRMRRSIPKRAADDREFPVRIRISVPGHGLGQTLTEMHVWLADRVGKENYPFHGGGVRGREDRMLIYLRDVRVAAELVERFGLKVGLDRHYGGNLASAHFQDINEAAQAIISVGIAAVVASLDELPSFAGPFDIPIRWF